MSYTAVRASESRFVPLRGLRMHARCWGGPGQVTPGRPPLVMLHGWMDVSASFQFAVDALAAAEGSERWVIAPDWRGFGLTESPPTDTYWFPDYLADLDALLDALVPHGAIDLLGHSLGGNIATVYAGLRPARIRRLVNLEGFGMPATRPAQAPRRLVQWLDELKTPASLRSYESLAAVAERLQKNNPLLAADKAAWLAPHWAALQPDGPDGGRWHLRGDPAHKRVNPVLYRVDEVLESWKLVTAPVLWVDGDRTDVSRWWGNRYPRDEFDARLAVLPSVQRARLSPSGHMLHHDQPAALAAHLANFLR